MGNVCCFCCWFCCCCCDDEEGDYKDDVIMTDFTERRNLDGDTYDTNSIGSYAALAQVTSIESYERTLIGEPWYFGSISREEAEDLLQNDFDEAGVFLIRRTPGENTFKLSVKCHQNNVWTCKHFKIFKTNFNFFYISNNIPFSSLALLVREYTDREFGFMERLTRPCDKPDSNVSYLSPIYTTQWEIAESELKILECIGSGAFANVYRGEWNTKQVAIKRLTGNFDRETIMNEMRVMKMLRHTNIVTFYGYSSTAIIQLVQEYIPNGCLQSYLRNHLVPEEYLTNFSYQICDGMEYLISRKILHRDLASRNILILERTDGIILKICDFGLSKIARSGKVGCKSEKIPLRWTAMEIFSGESYTEKSDVWSFGVTVHEIYSNGKQPYKYLKCSNDVIKYLREGKRLHQTNNMPPELYDLLLMCWNEDPHRRPTFKTLKSYFQDVYEQVN